MPRNTHLSDGKLTWHTNSADSGVFFYLLRVGEEQPNLAGIWGCLVSNPFCGLLDCADGTVLYLVCVPSASSLQIVRSYRLFLLILMVLAVYCPSERLSFLFALFTFILAITIAGMTTNEFIVNAVFHLKHYMHVLTS